MSKRTCTTPLSLVLAAALLLGACGSSPTPSSFDQGAVADGDVHALDASSDANPLLEDGVDAHQDVESDLQTQADSASSDGAIVDPNIWHEGCPIDEREQRMINVGEVSLNVACRGSGPTVVFLHGFPEFHYGWNKVMDELATEFRLVAPDQRGYNRSDKPEELEAYELPRLTQDILNLLPLVSPEPVILVAHDWGGPVGWLVAHHPDAFIRAFVSTNGPHPVRFAEYYAEDEGQQQASSYMNAFKQPWAEALFTEETLLNEFGFADILSDEEIEIYKEAWFQPGAITGGINWYRANDLTTMTTESLLGGMLEKVAVPTTVLWGLADTALLPGNIEGLDAFVSDLEIVTFEGVDHWIAHRIPEEVADGIRAIDLRSQ